MLESIWPFTFPALSVPTAFKTSFTSRRKTESPCVKRSRFFDWRFLSMPSIRCSKHCESPWSFSGLWLEQRLSCTLPKLSELIRIRPSSGLDMLHWFLQSWNIIIFNIFISGCCINSACFSRIPKSFWPAASSQFCEWADFVLLFHILQTNETTWSRVVQQLVQTAVSHAASPCVIDCMIE